MGDSRSTNAFDSSINASESPITSSNAAAAALELVIGDSDALIELSNALVDRLSPMSTGLFEEHKEASALDSRVQIWED